MGTERKKSNKTTKKLDERFVRNEFDRNTRKDNDGIGKKSYRNQLTLTNPTFKLPSPRQGAFTTGVIFLAKQQQKTGTLEEVGRTAKRFRNQKTNTSRINGSRNHCIPYRHKNMEHNPG